jgi:ribose-phosphate pyrophosphokinase
LQGFFDIPVDHLYAAPVFRSHYERLELDGLVVVATDVSAAKMARGYAKRLNGDLAIVDKRRPEANVAEVVNVVGDVEGRPCLIPDDMIDTAGTMVNAAAAVRARGATKVLALATHALLSGPAIERLAGSEIEEIVVSDTVPISAETFEALPSLRQVSVASLLGRAILSTHNNQSVSVLFD